MEESGDEDDQGVPAAPPDLAVMNCVLVCDSYGRCWRLEFTKFDWLDLAMQGFGQALIHYWYNIVIVTRLEDCVSAPNMCIAGQMGTVLSLINEPSLMKAYQGVFKRCPKNVPPLGFIPNCCCDVDDPCILAAGAYAGACLMPSSHFYVQSYGLLRFEHTWGVVVNRGRNRRVYLVMRSLSWANVSERIGSGRLKKFLNMFKNKKWIVAQP